MATPKSGSLRTANNDRRYFVLDVAMPINREDKSRFFSDYEAWRKAGGLGHILHELMQRPIGPRLPPMPYIARLSYGGMHTHGCFPYVASVVGVEVDKGAG